MSNLLPIALSYLNRGWSVIPVSKSKIPIIAWKEYTTRHATVEELIKWFSDESLENQIGIVCGKISGLTVIDIESEGDFSLIPDPTFKVKTGGGGIHVYFQYEPDFKNAVRLLPFLDCRNDSGYVVAPFSETTKGDYSPINDLEIATMSPETKALLLGAAKSQKSIIPTSNSLTAPEFPGYGQGERNAMTAKYIGSILARLHPSLWDTVGWDMVQEANKKNNPPLPEYEIKNTFSSIAARESQANPGGRTYKKIALPVFKDEEDAPVMLLSDIVSLQPEDGPETLIPSGFDEFDAISEGGFHTGDLITISGTSGSGKTSWSQTLVYNLAKRGVPSLFFSYEVLLGELWKKFKNMGVKDDMICYSPFKMVSGKVEWMEKKISEAKEKFGVQVVVVDHLGFCLPSTKYDNNMSQNFSAYLGQICRDFKTIAIKEEIVIILLAHVKKTDNPTITDIANSAGVAQESDHVFIVHRERATSGDDVFMPFTTISLEKNRRTGRSKKWTFEMKDGRFQLSQAQHDFDHINDKPSVPKVPQTNADVEQKPLAFKPKFVPYKKIESPAPETDYNDLKNW